MNNLNEIFESQKNKLRDKSLFWHKENGNWVSISWNEAGRQINILSKFLKKIEINRIARCKKVFDQLFGQFLIIIAAR